MCLCLWANFSKYTAATHVLHVRILSAISNKERLSKHRPVCQSPPGTTWAVRPRRRKNKQWAARAHPAPPWPETAPTGTRGGWKLLSPPGARVHSGQQAQLGAAPVRQHCPTRRESSSVSFISVTCLLSRTTRWRVHDGCDIARPGYRLGKIFPLSAHVSFTS